MIADCSSCDPRNPKPGQLIADPGGGNIHPRDAQVDYRNRDVSVESVLAVLTGNHPPGTPPSRRLDSGRNSSVLLFLTGHGGDGFLKFHDQNELISADLAAAVGQMHAAGRYGQMLIMLDTCQAATMYSEITAPGWVGIASSKLGQSSYALHSDVNIGAHLVDEFSRHVTSFLGKLPAARQGAGASMESMLRFVRGHRMSSEIDVDVSHFGRPLSEVSVAEFFGGDGAGSADAEAGETTTTALSSSLLGKVLSDISEPPSADAACVAGGEEVTCSAQQRYSGGVEGRTLREALMAAGRSS